MNVRRALALLPVAVLLIAAGGGAAGWKEAPLVAWCAGPGLLVGAVAVLAAWLLPGRSDWELRCGLVVVGGEALAFLALVALLLLAGLDLLEDLPDPEVAVGAQVRASLAALCLCVDPFTGCPLSEQLPGVLASIRDS